MNTIESISTKNLAGTRLVKDPKIRMISITHKREAARRLRAAWRGVFVLVACATGVVVPLRGEAALLDEAPALVREQAPPSDGALPLGAVLPLGAAHSPGAAGFLDEVRSPGEADSRGGARFADAPHYSDGALVQPRLVDEALRHGSRDSHLVVAPDEAHCSQVDCSRVDCFQAEEPGYYPGDGRPRVRREGCTAHPRGWLLPRRSRPVLQAWELQRLAVVRGSPRLAGRGCFWPPAHAELGWPLPGRVSHSRPLLPAALDARSYRLSHRCSSHCSRWCY